MKTRFMLGLGMLVALFAMFASVPVPAFALDPSLIAPAILGVTLTATNPTLLDLAKRLDPNGSVEQDIVEILNETNEILDDMTFIEGNLETGNRSIIRSGIPAPTWRKLYGTVSPAKSTTVPVTDNCGMLENYSKVDKALADLNDNTEAFLFSEDKAFIEGISQELAETLFYGNEGTEPEAFTGLAPRYNSLSAENASNIIAGGGSGDDNTSIWLIVWSPRTVHGIIPKGSRAGVQRNFKGQTTIQESGGMWEAYLTHYRLDAGLTLKDWRYAVRIANIDVSELTHDAATGADLYDLIAQAIEVIPNLGAGRPVLYCNRTVRSFMRRQAIAKVKQATLTFDTVAGKRVMAVDEIPVKRCDALHSAEATVS